MERGATRFSQALLTCCKSDLVTRLAESCLSYVEPWEPFKEAIMRLEIRGHSKAAEDPGVLEEEPKCNGMARSIKQKLKVDSSSTASGDEVDSPQTNKVTVAMSQYSQSFR